MKKKLVIDARMLGNSGIGRYLHNLLKRIPLQELKPTFLVYPELLKRYPFIQQYPTILTRATPYSIRQQLTIPFLIPPCDLFWTPHFDIAILPIRAKRIFLSFHDTFHFDHPHLFSRFELQYLKLIARRSVQRASYIMTGSKHAQSRLFSLFPKAKNKTVLIQHGIDANFTSSLSLHPKNQFVFIGTIKPHKNLPFLLKAFHQFQQEASIDYKLLLFGSKKGLMHADHIEPLIRKIQKENTVIEWIENASDQFIRDTLSESLALIFPSLYEGFGFPPLEAMAAGCATLVSNATSIPEVCQENSLYFDPRNQRELIEQMKAISSNKNLRANLIQKGLKHVRQFQWETAATRHLEIVQKLLS